jgi:uncharacterized protein (DUF58 family)
MTRQRPPAPTHSAPLRAPLRAAITRFLNRELPPDQQIQPRLLWPLYLCPWLLLIHLLNPSPIWVLLIITLLGVYAAAYFWVRRQAGTIRLERRRRGTMLVAGDSLQEEFVLHNEGILPLIWLEFDDDSYLPGYNPSQVVSCGANQKYTWRAEATCEQRGVFRLGPHRLTAGDPFGLFRVEVQGRGSEALLVYPRVAQLPPMELPRGALVGRDRRRRPLPGDDRSAVVRGYRAGDSLRHIHWPSTAHRGELMVSEVEAEPSGDLWIVLDLNAGAHRGSGPTSTLEYAIVMAASLTAELLSGGDRRAVGLLAAGTGPDGLLSVAVPPQPGKGHLWQILAALAPAQTGDTPLDALLRHNRGLLGRGQTVVVITPDLRRPEPSEGTETSALWMAELLHLRRAGVVGSALLVTPAEADEREGEERVEEVLRELLIRHEISAQFLQAGTPLRTSLTYRRRRTVLRTTPTGGVISREVEEEVG